MGILNLRKVNIQGKVIKEVTKKQKVLFDHKTFWEMNEFMIHISKYLLELNHQAICNSKYKNSILILMKILGSFGLWLEISTRCNLMIYLELSLPKTIKETNMLLRRYIKGHVNFYNLKKESNIIKELHH